MKTPLLVYTNTDFQTYLTSISRSARYEYRQAMKAGAGLSYGPIVFDRIFVADWMAFWMTQLILGNKHPRWRQWTPALAEKIGVRVFCADRSLGIQMAEVCGDYAYAWPVLYNKVKHPWVAKLMWFKLIEWCCQQPAIDYLDLGGGNGKTWRELLMNRDRRNYKWKYVPKHVKDHPEDAPAWGVFVCEKCGWRALNENRCSRCTPRR
jgi:hypothetical protein